MVRKTRVKFYGSCLKQDKATYNYGKPVNIYIVYEISKNYNISNYPTLENCLFGAVSLSKRVDIAQYKYSEYGIGFDRKAEFSFGNGFGRIFIIFGVNMCSSVHVDNKKKDILILGTTLTAEKLYSNIFTENDKKFCVSLHYNGANSYLFVNGTEIYKLSKRF